MLIIPPLLAQQQSNEHWKARHKAQFEKEELAREKERKMEELDQEMEIEQRRLNDRLKLKKLELVREMEQEEMMRKVRLGKGKMVIGANGLAELVELNEDEKADFAGPSTGGLEQDQLNRMLGSFKEEIAKIATANE